MPAMSRKTNAAFATLLAWLLAAFLGTACASPEQTRDPGRAGDRPSGPPEPGTGRLTILHTNDWHGHAFAEVDRSARGTKAEGPPAGGIVACAAAVARIRAENPGAVLALDCGDLLSGHPAASLEDGGVRGAPFVRAWSLIGYDAFAVGNHDLDAGRTNTAQIIALARAPALCANFLLDSGEPALPVKSYEIFERGGLKVAVIGLLTSEMPRLGTAATLAGTKTVPPVEAARPLVAKLRPNVDLVVALAHQGVEEDRRLAREIAGIDVIVGGHSHTRLEQPIVEGRTLIVQAGARGRELGRLDLVLERGLIVKHTYRLLPLPPDAASASAEVVKAVSELKKRYDELAKEVLGEAVRPLRRGNYYGESAIGDFVADAIRAFSGADVAFMNNGGIRDGIDAGPVTRGVLLGVLPFDNDIVLFDATGAELEEICRHNAIAAATKDHGTLAVSGVRYRWRHVRGGAEVELISVEVDGKMIQRERKYLCAGSDFVLFEQPAKYLGYVPLSRRRIAATIQGALEAAIRKGPICPPRGGRIVKQKEASTPSVPGAGAGG